MTPDLDQVLANNREPLIRIARQYAGANDWQDLLQEITLNLWRGLESFDGRAKLSTWVYRVAINTALQHVRKRRPDTEPLSDEPVSAHGMDDALHILEDFLASLDPVNRAVLLMDLDGLSREDAAEVLGLSEGAVAVRMTRLKARFSEQFLEKT